MSADSGKITDLLQAYRHGDRGAFEELIPLVYQDLRRVARQQLARGRRGETLNTTVLVNEVYLKLVSQKRAAWKDRAHFLAVAAHAMRQIIVDYARERMAHKRGGGRVPATLDSIQIGVQDDVEALLELERALEGLTSESERMGRLVECRFFAGMTEEETAEALGISTRTVQRDWARARVWLSREMAHHRISESMGRKQGPTE